MIQNEHVLKTNTDDEQPHENKIALLPLSIAIIICFFVSIFPQLLVNHEGIANHGAATTLFMAMSAGFIRGVGFVPKNKIIRGLFSTYSCLFFILLTAYILVHG